MLHHIRITTSSHSSKVNPEVLLDPHRPFLMSDLEALKDGPSSPVGPTLAPDIRHAEALQKLMERSMGSEENTSQRDGDAILR